LPSLNYHANSKNLSQRKRREQKAEQQNEVVDDVNSK
jgi:hypothetical protein